MSKAIRAVASARTIASTRTIASARLTSATYVDAERNAWIDPTIVNDSQSLVTPYLGGVGVIRSGATENYVYLDNRNCMAVLSPTDNRSGTITITAQGTGNVSVYARQSIGYVTLGTDANPPGFTLGSNNINIPESHFIAALVRVNSSLAIEGNSNFVNIVRTSANGASGGPNMQLAIGGTGVASAARRAVVRFSEGYTASVSTSLRLDESWTSTIAPTPSGGSNVKMSLFGDSSGRNGAPINGWVWIFCRGASTGENESGVSSLSMQATTSAQNVFTVGHSWVYPRGTLYPNSAMFAMRAGISQATTTGVVSGAIYQMLNQTLVLGDNSLGSAAKSIDIAAVMKISRRPLINLELPLLLSGISAGDLGLQPIADDDFQAYLYGSLAQSNASANVSGYSGTLFSEVGNSSVRTYYSSGGPTILRKLGVAVPGTPLSISVVAGVVQ